MPRVKRKQAQSIDFNTLLDYLLTLKGDDLKKWNQESLRRSGLLQKEFLERSKANIESFLDSPDATHSLAELTKHAGEVNLKWEIIMEQGESYLRVSVGDISANIGLVAGYSISDRVAVKRFISIINQHLLAATLSLFEASAIFASETVEKSSPSSWRRRFINQQVERLETLTGKSKKKGRPDHTIKNVLQKEDETNNIREDVIRAVRNLYKGKSDGANLCRRHRETRCCGHDIEEINVQITAEYLNINAGTLRNKLHRYGLKFLQLKREALADVMK